MDLEAVDLAVVSHTGEVGFRVFREVFGDDCLYAGLGSWIPIEDAR